MRGRDLIGHPVVDGSTGDDLAEVKDVVFDAARGIITGFTLRRRGFLGRRMKVVLPIESVVSVGTHAVMVDHADSLTDPNASDSTGPLVAGGDVLDDTVITESGRTLGTVRDVIVEGGPAPRVVGYEITGGDVGDGLVARGAESAISSSALIVPDLYVDRIRTDLTGFAAELALDDRTAP